MKIKALFCLLIIGYFFHVSSVSAVDKNKIDPKLWQQMQIPTFVPQDITYIVELRGVTGLRLENFGGDKAAFKKGLRDMHESARENLSELLFELREQGQVKSIEPLWIVNYAIVTGTPESVAQVSDVTDVIHIYYNHVYEVPKTPETKKKEKAKYTWGLTMINAAEAWSLGAKGQGITVGILDTGVDANHPDLKGKIKKFLNVTDDEGSSAGFDGQGHGSHTAGTIVGGSKGGTHIGVAPRAKLIAVKIFTAAGRTKLSWIMRAMQFIADPDGNLDTDDTPKVCSNSWGGTPQSYTMEKPRWKIVEKWRQLGMVPVFANGNSGPRPSTTGSPAGYPHSFAVGATASKDEIAYFSSRGPIKWQGKSYIKPDISAPGHGITSVKDGGGYRSLSGTSMACPHIAGVCALVLSVNPNLSVRQVESIIESTSLDLGSNGKDNSFGKGRVDAAAAVRKALKIKK
ncbi:S8 family serine peptidase [Candidatus Riflebacteria bacterium]